MRKFYLLSTLVLSILCSINSSAQDFSNKGKEFWLCFPNHIPSGANGNLTIWVTSDQASSGTVTMANGAFSATFNILANGIQGISVPHALAHISNAESGLVIQKSIKVKVDPGKPAIVAYAQQWGNARSAATLLLPTNVLGKKYRAMSFTHTPTTAGGQSSRSQFQIIATQPNTQVQVTPYSNGVAGTTFTIPLPQIGDMYQYQASSDVTGTLIESIASGSGSCLPIAVFSGNSAVTIGTPTCNGGSYDPLFQQMYPIATWGKNYGFVPFGDYVNGNPYRVMASENNTTVSFNGVVVATLNAGQIYPSAFTSNPVLLTEPTSITADKPISVAQYAQTSACSGSNNGDPDMVILNPIEQNIKDITIFASTQQNINRQWINVLIKSVAAPSFRIDGAVPTTPFVAAPNIPGFSYLRHMFTPAISGSHLLTADSGFNAIVYGFQGGNFESYAYSAGANVKDLYQEIGVSTEYGIEPTPSVCKNSPFKFKVKLPYCVDSIRWDLSNLPGPPSPSDPRGFYTTCVPGPGGPDSITVVNGKTLYWYSLPSFYSFNVAGTFPVSLFTYIPNSEGCGNEQEIQFNLSVFDPPTADFDFTGGGCIAEAVQFQDNTSTPRPSYIWRWDFGDPASGAANLSGLQNPTHIFSAPGTYNVKFSTITTPGCISAEIIKPVTIAPIPTASISGATTVCVNDSPEPQVTFTATGGTAPYTFSYHINSGPAIHVNSPSAVLTVNVPTGTPGTFTYHLDSVKNTGSLLCVTTYTNQSVDVVVNANTGLVLDPLFGSNTQAVCENVAIATIKYNISGGGNAATVTGLPAGVTGVYNAGVFTISGIPTLPGTTSVTYNYTITATGLCLPNSLTGSITVNPDAEISAPVGNPNQTACINTLIAPVSYNIAGGGTGGTVTFTPALPGVSGTYSGGILTITGTPTLAGTFNYTVNTTGTCVQASASGSITVTPDATISLTSLPATTSQTVCVNHAINNITYGVGGSENGGTVTFTPAIPGVTGVYNAASHSITISGTPTAPGTYTYIAKPTGPCFNPELSGTITVTDESKVTLSSAGPTRNQELCFNSTLTLITYSPVGSTTNITVTGLPTGLTAVFSGGQLQITGNPTQSGTFNYVVTPVGPCYEGTPDGGTIIVNPLPTPNFSVTTPSCETRVLTFTDLSTPNVGALSGWVWNFGDATPLDNTQNPTHIYPAAGTYTVTLSVTNDKGCVSNPVRSTAVTINPRPEADFTVPEVCINDNATVFNDISTVSSGTWDPAGYFWNFGDPASGANNTSTTQNGSHLFTAVGNYTVMHVVTTMTGCKDTTYHDIFINAADPLSDFTITNRATLCSNDSVSLVNLSTISQGSVTKLDIYWDVVGAPATFETINVPVFNGVYKHKYPTLQTTQTYTVRMIAYSGNICFTNKTDIITVNAAPKVQFNPVPNICLDAAPYQIPASIASEIGGVPGSGVFSGPGVSPGGLFTPSLVGPGTYLIKYTFTSSAAGCIDTLSNYITVLDSASARFTYSPSNCEGSPVSFNSSTSSIPSGAGSITGWSWDFGDPASGVNNTSTAQNPTHLFTSWGNYTVKLFVTTSNGCRSTVSTQTVYVNPLPQPAFTFPASACLPSATVAFNSSGSTIADGTQASFTYLWDFGDPASGALNTSTNSSPSHIYNSVGPFLVKLQITSGAGCVKSITIPVNSIHPQPTGSFTTNKPDVCIGQGIVFTDNSDPADGTTTQWNWTMDDGNTRSNSSFNYTYGTAGTYNVSLYITNSFGCRSTTATNQVTINPYPVVDAGPDLFILEDGSDTLQPVVTAINPTYLWTPNNYFLSSNTIKNPVVKGVEDITYTLLVTGRGGCERSDQVFIKVLKGPEIPNIFSPNGDGVHDKWIIKYLDTYPGGTVDIYNRYGQLIFHSVGYGTPWDGTVNGKPVPLGTYYYIVNPKNGRKIMSGYVDVIR